MVMERPVREDLFRDVQDAIRLLRQRNEAQRAETLPAAEVALVLGPRHLIEIGASTEFMSAVIYTGVSRGELGTTLGQVLGCTVTVDEHCAQPWIGRILPVARWARR